MTARHIPGLRWAGCVQPPQVYAREAKHCAGSPHALWELQSMLTRLRLSMQGNKDEVSPTEANKLK